MFTEILNLLTIERLFIEVLLATPVRPESVPMHHQEDSRPTHSELALLRRIIPNELYQSIQGLGLRGTQFLSFALRHRLTQLQLLFHASKIDKDSLLTCGELDLPWTDQPLAKELLQLWLSKPKNALPLFGFTPLGVYISERPYTLCRAYDPWSIVSCLEVSSGLFCTKHQSEKFWHDSRAGSRQAQLYDFYLRLENADIYSVEDLEQMQAEFWAKMPIAAQTAPMTIRAALNFFSIESLTSLHELGTTRLRQAYLNLAFVNHPDRGGSTESFLQLQHSYDLLRLQFRKNESHL